MLSPLDDRYKEQVTELVDCFSGFAYTKQRVEVELRYLQDFCGFVGLPVAMSVDDLAITEDDYNRINEIETVTNHDVKAIEYFLRDHLKNN